MALAELLPRLSESSLSTYYWPIFGLFEDVMKKNFMIALWFTLVTSVMFGILYPLAITGLAQVLFPDRANGQLIEKDGKTIGSRIIGQAFSGSGYFHSRP